MRHGFFSSGLPNLTPKEAFLLCKKGAVIIDLRPDYLQAYKQFMVPKVFFADPDKIIELVSHHPKDEIFIIAETTTIDKSRNIINTLRTKGFSNVYNLAGGFVEWERGGLPITEDKNERLSGSCMCQLRPRSKSK